MPATDNNWGMLTSQYEPKASYQSFDILANLTGHRLAVSGGDGEVNASPSPTAAAWT